MKDLLDLSLPDSLSEQTLQNFPLSMVLADATDPNFPIVYVNDAFTTTTGYAREDMVGQNCRILQGKGTRDADRAAIRAALAAKEELTIDILNYRKDGTAFVNRLMLTPLFDSDGVSLRYYLGVQTERSDYSSYAERVQRLDERLKELQHRIKNHLTMIVTMLRIEARSKSAEDAVELLDGRVAAMAILYDEFAQSEGSNPDDNIRLDAYLSRIATALNSVDGRPEIALNLDLDPVHADVDDAGQLGLYLCEVLTNSFKHAFPDGRGGRIRITLHQTTKALRLSITDDGIGMPQNVWPKENSLGGRIVLNLVQRIGGDLSISATEQGTRIDLTSPLPS